MAWLKLVNGNYLNVDSSALFNVQRHEHPDGKSFAHINVAYFATGMVPMVAAEGFRSVEEAQAALDAYMTEIGFTEIRKEDT